MRIGRFQLYKSKKDLWSLFFILLIVGLLISPYSDRTTGYIYALYQGDGTEIGGYKIHTGTDYLYHHHEMSGGVSLSKLSKDFGRTEAGYHLTFEEGAKKRSEEITKYCLREGSSCEKISFRNFEGITISNYIEAKDEILNQTFYFSSRCNVHVWHTGAPFDSKYLEAVRKFFDDNCSEKLITSACRRTSMPATRACLPLMRGVISAGDNTEKPPLILYNPLNGYPLT